MPKHRHEWVEAERMLVDGEPVMKERCACGVKRERPMTAAEAKDFKSWRLEMGRLDREGEATVEG